MGECGARGAVERGGGGLVRAHLQAAPLPIHWATYAAPTTERKEDCARAQALGGRYVWVLLASLLAHGHLAAAAVSRSTQMAAPQNKQVQEDEENAANVEE